MDLPKKLLDDQVRAYRSALPVYSAIKGVLEKTLQPLADSVAPGCEVAARPKAIASFAGKLVRKKIYQNPLVEMTDLCGARIVCLFESTVRTVCELIRARFGKAIDETNSLDKRTQLRVGEFGYRAVHYIIQLRLEEPWIGLTRKMLGKKVEIQVCTRLQHIWSDIGHDRVYKGAHELPEALVREVARIAAQFESLDEEFERVVASIDDYRSHFGAFLDDARLVDEINLQKVLQKYDPKNPAVPLRQAELAISLDRWQEAIDRIRSFQTAGGEFTPDLETLLGFALCQKDLENRKRPEYAAGLRHLENATARAPRSLMAWVRRAECIGAQDEATTLICYHNAYRIDSLDPAALAGYIRWQLNKTTSARFVELLRPSILDAIDRCERQASVNIDQPWVSFRAAFFRLLLIVCPKPEHKTGQARVAVFSEDANTRKELLNSVLKCYAGAISFCRNLTPLRVALETAEKLQQAVESCNEVDIVVLFLRLVLEKLESDAGHDLLSKRVARFASETPLTLGPGRRALIVVGTSRPSLIDSKEVFERIIADALADFEGTVFSGGTLQGVPGIVGRLGARAKGRFTTIGYIPNKMPASKSSEPSGKYSQLMETIGIHFSPMEPLQAWIDLTAAGIKPADVTVLGLGGGRIAAFEYRLALLLGARVGVIVGSGREADELAKETIWKDRSKWRLWRIPLEAAEQQTLRAFIHPVCDAPKLDYETLGRLVHEKYVSDNKDALLDPTLKNWEVLLPDYRTSSIEQIRSVAGLLEAQGFALRPRKPAAAARLFAFSAGERERLARLEHGRWLIERIGSGWTHGKVKDPFKKLHPDLVKWGALSAVAKRKDLNAVASWPRLLATAGYAIVRVARPRSPASRR